MAGGILPGMNISPEKPSSPFGSFVELSDRIIDEFMRHSVFRSDLVEILCRMAADSDAGPAREAVKAIFPGLIERLNDSFDPASCSLYDRIFARIIDFHRNLPGGGSLDEALKRFGLFDENDLLLRKNGLLKHLAIPSDAGRKVGKVMLLSRVTIGADVAVTSVILNKLRTILPDADFVILGSSKLRELYGGDPQLRVREIAYDRGGSVLARLQSWLEVCRAVDEESAGLLPDQFFLIDPDSRLSQLGLLPMMIDERNYYFFESRSFSRPGIKRIGELASRWTGELTSRDEPAFPFLALPDEHRSFGLEIAGKLRQSGAKRLVMISFGAGGNHRKRVTDGFEESLVNELLKDSTVILDKGATVDEREQINRICRSLRASAGKVVVEVDESNADQIIADQTLFSADVLTWDGGVGRFAALIAASDEYIGYDSAGQHLAAALGTPSITVFVNSNSPVFAERWSPYGRGRIDVVNVDASVADQKSDEILSQVLKVHEDKITKKTK